MEDERIAAGAAAAFSCQLMVLRVIKKKQKSLLHYVYSILLYIVLYILYYCVIVLYIESIILLYIYRHIDI